jgi:hypothetical protein
MPALNETDIARMRDFRSTCPGCAATMRQNYCRECDEFFTFGHAPACSLKSDDDGAHLGHRTYLEELTSEEPPTRTGTPPRAVELSGQLIAWGKDDQPVLLRVTGSPQWHLPCFASEGQLRTQSWRAGVGFHKIKRIEDGREFLTSVPSDVLVITGLHFAPTGRVRYLQVVRD